MRRKRSVRVIFAALLLLLPGLVATVALVRDVVQISQGAPPPPPMFSAQKAEELKQFVTGYRYTQLVIDAALFLLFVPPGWRLLRGRRFARAHATLVALLVAAGIAAFSFAPPRPASLQDPDMQTAMTVVAAAVAWATLIIWLSWQAGAASHFARPAAVDDDDDDRELAAPRGSHRPQRSGLVSFVASINILLSVAILAWCSYSYLRYVNDSSYRERKLDVEIAGAEIMKEKLLQRQGFTRENYADYDRVTVNIDRGELEATIRQSRRSLMTIALAFFIPATFVSMLVWMRVRWGRLLGILTALHLLFWSLVFACLPYSGHLSPVGTGSLTPAQFARLLAGILFGLGMLTLITFARRRVKSDFAAPPRAADAAERARSMAIVAQA